LFIRGPKRNDRYIVECKTSFDYCQPKYVISVKWPLVVIVPNVNKVSLCEMRLTM